MEDALVVLAGVVMALAAIWFLVVWPFRYNQSLMKNGSRPFFWGSVIIGFFFAFLWMTPIPIVLSLIEETPEGLSGWPLVGEAFLIIWFYGIWAFYTLNLKDRRRWAWGALMAYWGLLSIVTVIWFFLQLTTAESPVIAVGIWTVTVTGLTVLLFVYLRNRWQGFSQGFWLPWRAQPVIVGGGGMREINKRLWKRNARLILPFFAAMLAVFSLGWEKWALIPLLLAFFIFGNWYMFQLRCENCGNPVVRQGFFFFNGAFALKRCWKCEEPLP